MKRLLYLVIALVFLLTSPLTARANSTIGSLDCNQADPTLWHDGSGLTFGQGNGAASSFSTGGLCYSHLTSGTSSQAIRLASLAPDGYTGIPLVATTPEVTFDLSSSVGPTNTAGSAQYTYVLLRKTYGSRANNGREYRVRIGFTGNSSAGRNVRLKLSKVVSGVETTIGAEYIVPSTVAFFEPNRVLHVRVAAVGSNPTTLRANIWSDGKSEPAGWQLTATDGESALQSAGQIQLLTKVSASDVALPMDFMFDNFVFAEVN